jgi:outer membrane autotransporter protein
MGAFSNHPQPGVQHASSSDKVSGIAAGEGDHTMYGAWVSPFYSQTTQKARGSRAGYKADSCGATVGFDTQANADLTIGLAGTYAKTDAKHKNFKSGDKTKTDTFMFSVYGIQQLTNNWFLQGHAAYATNRVKSSEKLITSTTNQTAKASYDVTSYNTELLAGFNYSVAYVVVTPLIGASYTRVNGSGYTETGTTNQNRTVSTKATNKFEAIAGMRAQTTTEMNGINVTPEIHGFVRHDLIGKTAQVNSKISGMFSSSSKSAKALKTTYNVGLGVNAVSGMYEYGAGYDLFAGDKTIGHQGTLKVRVNF